MHRVSSFIAEMAKTLSDDLRESVAPDKLQHEVEKELEKQILAQTVNAIGKYRQARDYFSHDPAQAAIKRRQVLRFMGYCSEMWLAIGRVKGAISAGLDPEASVDPDNLFT